ncbi:helix-turn-helix domain-containing protein [Sedimenticola selenatireducens]|uniref:helix-turn-helix domain-containing protein n=1 Tax=Sedimenticola selenatireducens TaxID=191960 RepID=UPI003749D431
MNRTYSQPTGTSIGDCSVTETCTWLNCTPPTVYKLLASGDLEGYKIGRSRRITRESIQRLRSGNKATA